MKRLNLMLAALAIGMMVAASAWSGSSTDAGCWGNSAAGEELCINATGDLIPQTSESSTLGSASYKFASVFANDLTAYDDMVVTDDLTVTDDATINGKLVVDNDTAADTAILVKGAASQVGDLLRIATSGDTILVQVKSAGEVYIGNGTPDTSMGAEDLYVESNLEVDSTSRFDGALDINASLDVDGSVAGTTVLAVAGASSQSASLILAETSTGTDILNVTPTGVLVRLLTMAQVDVTTPGNAGELIVVTNRTTTGYGLCIATGTAVAQYKLISGTAIESTGCGTGL